MAKRPATIITTPAAIDETILAANEDNNKAYNIIAEFMRRKNLPARGKAPSRKEVSACLVWNAVATFKIGRVKRGLDEVLML